MPILNTTVCTHQSKDVYFLNISGTYALKALQSGTTSWHAHQQNPSHLSYLLALISRRDMQIRKVKSYRQASGLGVRVGVVLHSYASQPP